MYKNQDDLAPPLHASQQEEREDLVEERDVVADIEAEEKLPSHITVVPFSTTKTGSFQ